MSVGLYYSARRDRALTADERRAVADLITADDDRDVVAGGSEPFCVYPYEDLDDGMVLDGSTKLPEDLEQAWEAIQHWARLVSAIRRAILGAEWHFSLDDYDIAWDDEQQEYDPAAEAPLPQVVRAGARFGEARFPSRDGNLRVPRRPGRPGRSSSTPSAGKTESGRPSPASTAREIPQCPPSGGRNFSSSVTRARIP